MPGHDELSISVSQRSESNANDSAHLGSKRIKTVNPLENEVVNQTVRPVIKRFESDSSSEITPTCAVGQILSPSD